MPFIPTKYVPDTFESKIRTWLLAALGGSIEVIYGLQAGPQKKRASTPVCTFETPTELSLGTDRILTDTPDGDDWVEYTFLRQDISVDVKVFGTSHRSLMRQVVNSLEQQEIRTLNNDLKIYVKRAGTIQTLPESLENSYLKYSQCDFTVSYAEKYTGTGEGLETIVGEMTFDNLTSDISST